MNKIPYYYALPAILISTLLATAVILAWQEPTQTPPQGNVPTPLNVGRFAQEKIGGLILNTGNAITGLVVDKGKVGIGTREPAQTLDVQGTAKMAGFQLPTNAGLNKVLVSDALGFGTWQARAAGAGSIKLVKDYCGPDEGDPWGCVASVDCGPGLKIIQCGKGMGGGRFFGGDPRREAISAYQGLAYDEDFESRRGFACDWNEYGSQTASQRAGSRGAAIIAFCAAE